MTDVVTVFKKPHPSRWLWSAPGRWRSPRDAIEGPCREMWMPMSYAEAEALGALPLEPGEYIEIEMGRYLASEKEDT